LLSIWLRCLDFQLGFGTSDIKLMDLEPYGHSDSD